MSTALRVYVHVVAGGQSSYFSMMQVEYAHEDGELTFTCPGCTIGLGEGLAAEDFPTGDANGTYIKFEVVLPEQEGVLERQQYIQGTVIDAGEDGFEVADPDSTLFKWLNDNGANLEMPSQGTQETEAYGSSQEGLTPPPSQPADDNAAQRPRSLFFATGLADALAARDVAVADRDNEESKGAADADDDRRHDFGNGFN